MYIVHEMDVTHSDINCVNDEQPANQVVADKTNLFPVCPSCSPDANGGVTVANTVIVFQEAIGYFDIIYLN